MIHTLYIILYFNFNLHNDNENDNDNEIEIEKNNFYSSLYTNNAKQQTYRLNDM